MQVTKWGARQGEFRRDVRHSRLRIPGLRRKHGWNRQRVPVPEQVLVGPVSDKTRHERPKCERTCRVVAVTHHFDVSASCIAARV